MTRHLLNRQQAEAFCENFQTLVGESFEGNNGYTSHIECVTVCPFDDISKYIFVTEYHKYKDAAKALEMYISPLYDVLVIAEKGPGDIFPVYMRLTDYLNLKKIHYQIMNADTLETEQ